jgi:hypothetical protein
MNVGRYIFARLYGYTLWRSFRNAPEQACQDAITQFVIVIGVPVLCGGLVPLSLFFPKILASKDWIPWVAISGGIVMYLITKSMGRYARCPEIAADYRSSASRRITIVLYVAVLLGSVLIAGLAGRMLRQQ